MCNHLVPRSCLCLCTPPQLRLFCYNVLPVHHPCWMHKPKSIPFISSTIEHLIHYIDRSPPLSCLPYLVILMLHCHSVLFSR